MNLGSHYLDFKGFWIKKGTDFVKIVLLLFILAYFVFLKLFKVKVQFLVTS